MSSIKVYAIIFTAVMAMGCAAQSNGEPEAFVNRSADVNGGAVHEATVTGMTLQALMLRIQTVLTRVGQY